MEVGDTRPQLMEARSQLWPQVLEARPQLLVALEVARVPPPSLSGGSGQIWRRGDRPGAVSRTRPCALGGFWWPSGLNSATGSLRRRSCSSGWEQMASAVGQLEGSCNLGWVGGQSGALVECGCPLLGAVACISACERWCGMHYAWVRCGAVRCPACWCCCLPGGGAALGARLPWGALVT